MFYVYIETHNVALLKSFFFTASTIMGEFLQGHGKVFLNSQAPDFIMEFPIFRVSATIRAESSPYAMHVQPEHPISDGATTSPADWQTSFVLDASATEPAAYRVLVQSTTTGSPVVIEHTSTACLILGSLPPLTTTSGTEQLTLRQNIHQFLPCTVSHSLLLFLTILTFLFRGSCLRHW